jgi:phytoene dehydrogenase-like protein
VLSVDSGEPESRVPVPPSRARVLPAPTDPCTREALLERLRAVVAKITTMAPNFPDLVDRQVLFSAHANELMFGCTGGDFTHGLLQPESMGPSRPGPGPSTTSLCRSKACGLCGAGSRDGLGIACTPG